MKVICTTIRKIEEETTCKKIYCCNPMKKAMNEMKYGSHSYDKLYPCFKMTETGIKIKTHDHYEHDSHYEEITVCPFCGAKAIVEHEKVDNTGLPPKEPLPPEPVKKKHWWNK